MLTESQKTKLADYKNNAAASTKAKERLTDLFDDVFIPRSIPL